MSYDFIDNSFNFSLLIILPLPCKPCFYWIENLIQKPVSNAINLQTIKLTTLSRFILFFISAFSELIYILLCGFLGLSPFFTLHCNHLGNNSYILCYKKLFNTFFFNVTLLIIFINVYKISNFHFVRDRHFCNKGNFNDYWYSFSI